MFEFPWNSLSIPFQIHNFFIKIFPENFCLVQADPSNYSDLEKLIHDFFLNLRHTAVFSSCIGLLWRLLVWFIKYHFGEWGIKSPKFYRMSFVNGPLGREHHVLLSQEASFRRKTRQHIWKVLVDRVHCE